MAEFDDVKAALADHEQKLAANHAAIATATTLIQQLQAQVAAGQTVSGADLEAIATALKADTAGVAADDASLAAAINAPLPGGPTSATSGQSTPGATDTPPVDPTASAPDASAPAAASPPSSDGSESTSSDGTAAATDASAPTTDAASPPADATTGGDATPPAADSTGGADTAATS